MCDALEQYVDANIIFTKTNADTYGRAINRMIDEFVENNKKRSVAHTSLGQIGYLSALKHVDAVVGNSSSGLLEAPSFGIGTINIGDRQKGRVKAASVIDCVPICENILDALHKIYSQSFQEKLLSVSNPYGEGGASEKIVETLKKLHVQNIDVQKTFFDLDAQFSQKV